MPTHLLKCELNLCGNRQCFEFDASFDPVGLLLGLTGEAIGPQSDRFIVQPLLVAMLSVALAPLAPTRIVPDEVVVIQLV